MTALSRSKLKFSSLNYLLKIQNITGKVSFSLVLLFLTFLDSGSIVDFVKFDGLVFYFLAAG